MFNRKNLWKEGKYLDMWAIPHTLFGVWGALVAYLFNLPYDSIFFLISIVAIGWEIGEVMAGVFEYFWNKVLDVVTAVVGYVLTFYLLGLNLVGDFYIMVLLVLVSVVFVSLNVWGWTSYVRSRD